MKTFTISEAIKEIAFQFPLFNVDAITYIEYADSTNNKFIVSFGSHKYLINLDEYSFNSLPNIK